MNQLQPLSKDTRQALAASLLAAAPTLRVAAPTRYLPQGLQLRERSDGEGP